MCCGSKRAAARDAAMAAQSAGMPAFVVAPAQSVILFEYTGAGHQAVRGPVSGKLYAFTEPGARVQVDARDRPGLMAMPALRWVR